MNDPARRGHIEEIRRRNRELQRQLNVLKQNDSGKSNEKSVEQMAKEALEASKVAMPTQAEDISKSTFVVELLRRKFLDSLRETNFTEFFVGCKPEKYDEGCQCQSGQTGDDESEDEQEVVLKIATTKDQLLKKRIINEGEIKEGLNPNRPLKYIVLPEDKRKEVSDKKREDLNDFVIKERKKMERALNQEELYEFFKKNEDEEEIQKENNNKYLNTICDFYDDACFKRVVIDLDWSLKYQELLLAAYSKSDDFNISQMNGLILLWSLALRKSPEFTFTCQTEVTAAIFHTYNPKIVIGGTYTGQIHLWDTRGKSTPYQKTAITVEGKTNEVTSHHSPITSLGIIGSNNANHLISISSDGVLCTWTIANLSKPVNAIQLNKIKAETRDFNEIGALAMGVQRYDTNNILVGAEDNNIYHIALHEKEANSHVKGSFIGHDGPIYSIDIHPEDYFNAGNFSHLFVTSSADWTTRIWSKSNLDSPLLTLDTSDDYVYSSKWCPTNASVLATGDGCGVLNFWDLNKNIEAPIHSHSIGDKEVINKMTWSNDGKRLAVGNDKGKVTVFGIERQLYSSTIENSVKFEQLISRLKFTK